MVFFMCKNYESAKKLKQKSHELYHERVERVSLGIEKGKRLSPNSMFDSINKPKEPEFKINLIEKD